MFSDFSKFEAPNKNPLENRLPAVAGRFYSDNPDVLYNELQQLFNAVNGNPDDNVAALIAPHAGYVFSGKTAAAAYGRINPKKTYKNIFILATSHCMHFEGASIYHKGNYEMPLGEVKVNTALAEELTANNPCFSFIGDAHKQEHSIEVQLPFLQFLFEDNFQIIPVVIGTSSLASIEAIANALKPYFNEDNLFIVSTDFSHYPSYDMANTIDNATINAILDNNAKKLYDIINANEKKYLRDLSTCLCGWSAVLCLLMITENIAGIKTEKIDYCNSGDAAYGDKDKVVGYAAIAFTRTLANAEFSLSAQEQNQLIHLAHSTLNQYIKAGIIDDLSEKDFIANLHKPYGVFVSLYSNNKLRGCIGCLVSDTPLYKNIQQMTLAAATKDTRFEKIKEDELDSIGIEISVLSPLKLINSLDEIILGTHGVCIKKGLRTGTFLPQVATQTNWSTEEFVIRCAKDKAGLNDDEWQTAELYTYTAFIFGTP